MMQKYVSDARELRDTAEISLQRAKRILRGEQLRADIERAQDLDDLRDVLRRMAVDLYPEMPSGITYLRKPYSEAY